MSTAAGSNPVSPTDHSQLTIDGGDGWVTAQVVEFPAAISQGRTEHEAGVNVVDALRDLTHEPTPAERLALTVQTRIVEPLVELRERFNAARRSTHAI
jgi:hypothetical protein